MPQAKKPQASTKPIVRSDIRAWWCPCCDRSNTHLTPACACGAVRDGDKVRVP